MWAGGRLEFHAPIPIGPLVSDLTVDDVVIKEGKTGTLCFVTVASHGGRRHALHREQQDRLPQRPRRRRTEATARTTPTDADVSKTVTSEVLLFRYSALTFNNHRIHYDRRYASDVEGYDGLVVHDPLTATLLAKLAADTGGDLAARVQGRLAALDTAPFRSTVAAPRPAWISGRPTPAAASP